MPTAQQVKEWKNQVRIWIRKEDIKLGWPRHSQSCPVALAFKRKFPGAKIIHAFATNVAVDSEIYYATHKAVRFVVEFDKGLPVKPGWLYYRKES